MELSLHDEFVRLSPVALSLDVVLRDIGPEDITPHFQPIVDLRSGAVVGHEILSRGPASYRSPSVLFARAGELGLIAELERACHGAALTRVAQLALAMPRAQWFVNVSPDVFCDGAEQLAAIVAVLRNHGLEPRQIVLEITEREPIADARRLERAVQRYVAAGFRIALDDFGSGVNGLLTLLACRPHIIKLDMELTRGVHADVYRQNIVRSIAALAASVNAELIAEGVETRAERDALLVQGVRLAQGRLFGAPAPQPATCEA
ncbi:MAG TPA: EAL domain-containing protein [Thermoanaerobaculia bacterium]|nr:EAL domain-containing protein [Thermoanaerobaculia bacterium]